MRNAALVTAAAVIALAAIAAGNSGASEAATAALRLDGVPFRPELARTPSQRSTGLMHRTDAPKDGMLFVFPQPTTGGFWMKNTLVPLTIVFYDSKGRLVRRMAMTPCVEDPCKIYDPRRTYRFALELPAADTRSATRIGPLGSLARLARSAR